MKATVSASMMVLGSAVLVASCQLGDDQAGDDSAVPPELSGAPGAPRTGFVVGVHGQPIEVGYHVIDGWAYQDDIGLGPAGDIADSHEAAVARTQGADPAGAMASGQGARWPNGVLFYQIDPNLSATLRTAAQTAINHYNAWSGATGVTLVDGANGDRHLRIEATTDVARVSDIGYTGRKQFMYLNSGIWQVAVHELGHALGLWHEHQRCERDLHLTVACNNNSNFTRQCGLPTTQPYNTMSVMHYSSGEMVLRDGTVCGSFRAGVRVAPAKSAHPGLIDADVRSLAALYGRDGTFWAVNAMHGKCLDATLSTANGTRVVMWDCVPGAVEQRWTYSAATGELKMRGTKCLDGWTGRRLDPIVIHDCHGGGNQKWDIGSHGEITLRNIRDELGRPLCLDINSYNRANGAQLLLQYCHRGDNQLWRRSPGAGGSTVSVVSDLASNRCMDAPSGTTGTQLQIWDCGGAGNANQRFTRTAAREMRIHGKCLDGDAGAVGSPVKVWDCHGGVNQQWDLTPSGEVKGVNNLCVQPAGAGTGNGTRLVLAACTNSHIQKWDYRDLR